MEELIPTPFTKPKDPKGLLANPPTSQQTSDFQREQEKKRENYSWGSFLQDAANYDWATTSWLMSEKAPAVDPDWEPSREDMEAAKAQVPEYLHDELFDAHSAEHLQWLIPRLKAKDEAISRLENTSSATKAGRIVLSMLDPVELGASIGAEALTLGYATPMIVAKYGVKAKNAARLMGGASNAAVGVGINAAHGADSPTEFGMGMAMDFVLGAALAPSLQALGKKQAIEVKNGMAGTPTKLDEMAAEYESLSSKADAPEGSTVGAAQNNPSPDAVSQGLTLTPEASQEDVPMGQFAGARMSTVGRAVTSQSPIERAIAPYLGEDAVGNVGEKTAISAGEWAAQNHQMNEARWKKAIDPAWDEWAKQEGISTWWRKMPRDKDWQRFSSQVVDYIEDTRPNADDLYPDPIVKAGKRAREVYADFVDDMVNPGRRDGVTLRPLEGAQRLEKDPFYVPKVADREAIDQMIATHGEANVKRLVREAISAGLTREGKEIEDKLLDKVAEGYYRNISSAAYGMGDELGEVLGGRSASKLKATLTAAGIDEESVDQIVAALNKKDAGTPRLKQRAPIDYNYKINTPTGEISMRDMFSRDIDHITMAYSRRMSGEIALGRVRIKDPTGGDNAPYWIDGITSRAEFEQKVLQAIRDDHFRRKLGADKTEAAIKRAEFLYRAVLGLPQHNMSSTATRALRRIRDYNFLRLMNAMGVTQAIEIGRVFSMTGMKAALSHMPSLKRVIEQGSGDRILDNKMARELEMWGVTDNDYWIGASRYRFQEELVGETPVQNPGRLSKLGGRYDDLVQRGKEILATSSLMRPVHSRLQQWAARATVQFFADTARNPASWKKAMPRLLDMGLGEEDLTRIAEQIKAHASAADPEMRTITSMNFEKWEPEVRSKFLHAVRRYTNRIVQKNEVGNLPMFMENPIAKTFMQFRTFTFAAYEKSTLWELKHRDQQSIMVALGDITFGAATYALMAHARAAGREDRQEFLDKELTLSNLATMGFARSGISSIAPMFIDLALSLTPAGPMFVNARSSGTPTEALGGSAAIDMLNGLAGASKAMTSSLWEGRELSQQELRGMVRNLPFGNHPAIIGLLNSMISDRSLMAPDRQK